MATQVFAVRPGLAQRQRTALQPTLNPADFLIFRVVSFSKGQINIWWDAGKVNRQIRYS